MVASLVALLALAAAHAPFAAADCDPCCQYIDGASNVSWSEVGDQCSCATRMRAARHSPSIIPYMELHACDMACVPTLSYIFAALWLLFLFSLVASTADEYLVPNLERLSDLMGLSPNVAGVTLLALGNGAPDFFTSLAAFRSTSASSIGIGNLLGGGIFITSLVLGSVAIVKPFSVDRRPLIRDCGFYLLATLVLAYVCFDGQVTTAEAIGLVSLYAAYVAIVIVGRLVYQRCLKPRVRSPAQGVQSGGAGNSTRRNPLLYEHEEAGLAANGGRGGRWAHGEGRPSAVYVGPASFDGGRSGVLAALLRLRRPRASSDPNTRCSEPNPQTSYEVPAMCHTSPPDCRSRRGAAFHSWSNLPPPDAHGPWDASQRGGEAAVAATRDDGAPAACPPAVSPLTEPTGDGGVDAPGTDERLGRPRNDTDFSFMAGYDDSHRASDVGLSPLTSPDAPASASRWPLQTAPVPSPTAPFSAAAASGPAGAAPLSVPGDTGNWPGAEVSQLHKPPPVPSGVGRALGRMARLAWQLPAQLAAVVEWEKKSTVSRLVYPIELLFVIARDLTVPLVDTHRWRRGVCALSVAGAPQLLVYRFGSLTAYTLVIMPNWVVVALVSLPVALLVYKKTSDEAPPKSGSLAFCLLSLAFVTACLWTDLIATELVAGLEFFGVSIGISRSILGLTVLAMGNSVGDFVADTALARAGNPKMGAAGCYGGPLFNMLMGGGVGLCITTLTAPSGIFCLPWDREVPLSILFLLGSILISLIAIPLCKFKMGARLGAGLVLYYALFLVCALLYELSDVPSFSRWLHSWYAVSHGECLK